MIIQGSVILEQKRDKTTNKEIVRVIVEEPNFPVYDKEKKTKFVWRFLKTNNKEEYSISLGPILHLKNANYGRAVVCEITREGMYGAISNAANPYYILEDNITQYRYTHDRSEFKSYFDFIMSNYLSESSPFKDECSRLSRSISESCYTEDPNGWLLVKTQYFGSYNPRHDFDEEESIDTKYYLSKTGQFVKHSYITTDKWDLKNRMNHIHDKNEKNEPCTIEEVMAEMDLNVSIYYKNNIGWYVNDYSVQGYYNYWGWKADRNIRRRHLVKGQGLYSRLIYIINLNNAIQHIIDANVMEIDKRYKEKIQNQKNEMNKELENTKEIIKSNQQFQKNIDILKNDLRSMSIFNIHKIKIKKEINCMEMRINKSLSEEKIREKYEAKIEALKADHVKALQDIKSRTWSEYFRENEPLSL